MNKLEKKKVKALKNEAERLLYLDAKGIITLKNGVWHVGKIRQCYKDGFIFSPDDDDLDILLNFNEISKIKRSFTL